jgi:hypothetical protein
MRRAKEEIYMESKKEGKNLPEKKFSTGAISATIWNNQAVQQKTGEKVAYKTISLQRRYKDKTGEWKSTNYLRLNDLPRASLVLNKAYEYLLLKETAGNNPEEELPEEMVDVEDVY